MTEPKINVSAAPAITESSDDAVVDQTPAGDPGDTVVHESHARLTALVESSDDAIVSKTLDGTITSWNRAAERLFGYTSSEALGQPITLIIPDDRLGEETMVITKIQRGETVDRFETVRIRKDGQLVDIALTASPIRDRAGKIVGASKIARDIRDRKRADEARGQLAAIIESSDDAIVSKTLDGIITSWNRAATRMFGYTAAEAVGHSISLIIPAEHSAEAAEAMARLRRGEPVEHFDTVRVRKDGTPVEISVSISPIKDSLGRIIGVSKIARDITESKRVERERVALLEESQQANRAKDEFLAMLGHELRNPLGALTTAARILEGKAPEAMATRARGVIARQTSHLTRIVDDLLEVGRVVAGKIDLDLRTVDVAEAVNAHLSALREAGKLGQHAVTAAVEPVLIEGDPARIEQIIGNLVGNALKYTPVGGTVHVAVRRVDDDAVLEVIDDGIGMPPELTRRAFELFVQGERPRDRAQGGLGIGLTLVRRLVELHGGRIEAHSDGPGRGCRMTARLPTPRSPAVPEPESTPRLETELEPGGQRIVIVEDNDDVRDMLRYLLESIGHEVDEASDGLQGLAKVAELRPDVALVDIGLPGIDGFEVARRLRASGDAGDTLLIALTGYGMEKDRVAVLAAGFDRHLTKPVEPDLLIQILHDHRKARMQRKSREAS